MDIMDIIDRLNEEESTNGATSDLPDDLQIENAGWSLAEEEGWIADETTAAYCNPDLREFVTPEGEVVAWNDQTSEWAWEGNVAAIVREKVTLSAEITGKGEDSSIPDNADAVDADVYVDGEVIGQATLLPHEQTGELDTYGDDPRMWADDALLVWMEARGGVGEWKDEIAATVREVV